MWPTKRKELCIYMILLAVDTLAMSCTAVKRTTTTEALQWAMLAIESLSMCYMVYNVGSSSGRSRWERMGASRLCASVPC